MIFVLSMMAGALAQLPRDQLSAKQSDAEDKTAAAAEAAAITVDGPARTMVAPDLPPASAVLAENRLSIALWQDDRLKVIYKPYFDCYWENVKNKSDTAFSIPNGADQMFAQASQLCSSQRANADGQAGYYLAELNDYYSPSVRADTISRYRRQVGTITLLQHYHDVGKGDLINQYLATLGQSDRIIINAPHQ